MHVFFILLLLYPSAGTAGVEKQAPSSDAAQALEAELAAALPRSSPLPEDGVIDLDGPWRFHPSPPEGFWKGDGTGEGWKAIRVPGEWAMQGFTVKGDTAAGYARAFDLPKAWTGKRVKLRFDSVYSSCRVYVNGSEVGGHEGGFVPFEVDVTEAVHPGRNVLALTVRNGSLRDVLASATQYAAHPLGGIQRRVRLFALPEVNLADLKIETDFDRSFEDAVLRLRLDVANEGPAPAGDLSARISIKPWKGKGNALEKVFPLPAVNRGKTARVPLEIPVEHPAKWDCEHPNLYVLRLDLRKGAQVLETVTERFGFRRVEVRGRTVLVNGKPVKLHGLCRHEVHPLLGRAITDELRRRDAELFRDMNCNFVRTSHYPPGEGFLDACDELGLFVELEAPLCWVGHGANAAWRKWNPGEERFYTALRDANLETVQGFPNHPSVILRSLANESAWTPLFERVARLTALADPTRPLTFHDQCWGNFNNQGSTLVPVANIHYPGPGGPARAESVGRPVTFGEFCHLETYNRRELAADPGLREAYGRALAPMWDAMYAARAVLGGSIWSGIDDLFYLPDGKVVGYGEWGPIDGWRRKKPEYWHIKKSYTPVRLARRTLVLPKAGEPLRIAVENRYNFTDLSEVKIEWSVEGGRSGAARARVPPRSPGVITLPVTRRELAGKALLLRFLDPRGFVADEYRLKEPASPAPAETAPPAPPGGAVRVAELPGAWRIEDGTAAWRVSRKTGRIEAGNAAGFPVIVGGPELMVLPLESGPCRPDYALDVEPLNDPCTAWQAASVTLLRAKGAAVVEVRGRYAEAEGGYTLTFPGDGRLVMEYAFTSTRDVNPRQWGMVFHVSGACSTLRWKRDAYWTLYPKGHLGRPEGTASAVLSGRRAFGARRAPAWPWGADETPLGSNDFRATRRGIRFVELRDPGGPGVRVESDGRRAARAWREGEELRLLVAGFDTGGADGFLGSHYAGERRPLRKGDPLEDRITLRLYPGK